MELNFGERIVYEFYSRQLQIDAYPLRQGVTAEEVVQLLSSNGYDVSSPTREDYPNIFKARHLFQDGSDFFSDRMPDKIFLISKMEKLRGILRYRRFENGNSVKIESEDSRIEQCLSVLTLE